MTPIDQATDTREDLAWTYLESVYLDVENEQDPNDLEYCADEMVAAFIAGMEQQGSSSAAALIEKQAALTEALGLIRELFNANYECEYPHDGSLGLGQRTAQFLARQGAE